MWDIRDGNHRDHLQRIVALLMALADLADRATAEARFYDAHLLWTMHNALLAVRCLMADLATSSGQTFVLMQLGAPDLEYAEALPEEEQTERIAAAFRQLAQLLAWILAVTGRRARQSHRHDPADCKDNCPDARVPATSHRNTPFDLAGVPP